MNKKDILWEEGMTPQDYKIRKDFHNHPFMPNYIPYSSEADIFLDLTSSQPEQWDDSRYVAILNCSNLFREEIDQTYASISQELFDYSLFGVESFFFKDF